MSRYGLIEKLVRTSSLSVCAQGSSLSGAIFDRERALHRSRDEEMDDCMLRTNNIKKSTTVPSLSLFPPPFSLSWGFDDRCSAGSLSVLFDIFPNHGNLIYSHALGISNSSYRLDFPPRKKSLDQGGGAEQQGRFNRASGEGSLIQILLYTHKDEITFLLRANAARYHVPFEIWENLAL